MLKTSIRRFEESLQSGNMDEAKVTLSAAVRQIDRAATRGVVHKNTAARKKSRLSRIFNQSLAV
jgi:small subunit ribosomal protein S20